MPAATSRPSASLSTGTGIGAGGQQRAAAGDVAGVLHPGGIARIQQQLGGDAQRLLGAGGDHDAAGSATRPRVAARWAAICSRSSGSPWGGG